MQPAIEMQAVRQAYAEELRAVSDLRSETLVRAFATVSREHFLGPGPWQIVAPVQPGRPTYRTTEDADPRHLYHNVLVAIDPDRQLNNGEPSFLALCFDALDLRAGDRVVHIGCGVGYYTAILAEVVGTGGHVTAVEVDANLAARARENLAHMTHVSVITGDAAELSEERSDVIFVNAGVTHPRAVWLDSLRTDGRLLLPLTATVDSLDHTSGGMLKITRTLRGHAARFISSVAIFPCTGARDPRLNAPLASALRGDSLKDVKSLRTDSHQPEEACWLHNERFCLSTSDP
jgi:protein-L-isoaspartate(D-aspartate) O-methyltransferase